MRREGGTERKRSSTQIFLLTDYSNENCFLWQIKVLANVDNYSPEQVSLKSLHVSDVGFILKKPVNIIITLKIALHSYTLYAHEREFATNLIKLGLLFISHDSFPSKKENLKLFCKILFNFFFLKSIFLLS